MAAFNPDVPKQNDPNYWYWSRSIEKPDFVAPTGDRVANTIPNTIADTSKGELLKGIGDIGSSAVKLADQYAESSITNEAYNKASASRDAEKQRLERMAGVVGEGNEGESLVEGDTQKDGPASLRALPSTLASYDDARANGKISQTYYYMALDKQASDMRARYPGYRDYIDQTFEKVTGVKPANAVIHSLVADINAATATANAERNKALSLGQQWMGVPGMDAMLGKVQSGAAGYSDVVKMVSPFAQQQFQWEQHKARWADVQVGDAEAARDAGLAISDHATKATTNTMGTVQWDDGKGGGPQPVSKIIEDAALGKRTLSADEMVNLSASVKQQYNTLFTQLWNEANQPGSSGQPSAATRYGSEATAKEIKAKLLPFETLVNFVGAGDFKMADFTAKRVEAIQQDDLFNLLNNNKPIIRTNNDGTKTVLGTVGDYIRIQAAIAKTNPKLAADVLTNFLQSDFGPGLKTLIQDGGLRMAAGPNVKGEDGKPMGQVTPKVITDTARDNPNVTPKQVGQVVQRLAEAGARFIQDERGDVTARANTAEAYFSPNNMGTIKDVKQPEKRASLYSTYTSPEMTKAVWDLKGIKPDLWNNYKGWATQTAALEVIPGDIDNLHQLQQNFKDVGRDDVKIAWDDVNHRISLDNGPDKGVNLRYNIRQSPKYEKDPHMAEAAAAVNRMNVVVTSLVNIAKREGTDPNAYVYRTLVQLNPNLAEVQGLKEAIGKSGTKPEKPLQEEK